jgi:hypothetical protein
LRFVVARATDDLDPAIAVDAATPFLLGASEGAIRRLPLGSKTASAVWEAVDGPITTPRVAALVGGGYAVAFRSGGKAGRV